MKTLGPIREVSLVTTSLGITWVVNDEVGDRCLLVETSLQAFFPRLYSDS